MKRYGMPVLAGLLLVAALVLATFGSSSTAAQGQGESESTGSTQAASEGGSSTSSKFGTEYENTGTGPMVKPTIPETPSVDTYFGELSCKGTDRQPDPREPAPEDADCTRVFHLTAKQFKQKISNFPLQTAQVWGYDAPGVDPSSPGPTLISYQGEQVQLEVTNKLSEPTTIHPHGLHQPNLDDGVPVVSQPKPIPAGKTSTYRAFMPGHVGSFAYHSHFDSAVQEMRGLNGMWNVLPRQEHQSVKPDVDVNMTLQIWAWPKNGALVKPFGFKTRFPIDTINGKTGDASGGPINIQKGDLVRIRVYNASQQTHAMHLHGHDELVVSKNGHAMQPPRRETTQTVTPGDFFEIEFRANNPGNWIFHCHFPHHTSNGHTTGFNGAPVGMTRIFHYENYRNIDPKYFSSESFQSDTVKPVPQLHKQSSSGLPSTGGVE